MMSGIKGKNTHPELTIRKQLHAIGFRYRINDKRLAGKPDLVFPRCNAVLFVNGCFWHSHNCHLFKLPKTRTEFWKNKLEGNVQRDKRNQEILQSQGWRVGIVWECALKGKTKLDLQQLIDCIVKWLKSDRETFEVGGTR